MRLLQKPRLPSTMPFRLSAMSRPIIFWIALAVLVLLVNIRFLDMGHFPREIVRLPSKQVIGKRHAFAVLLAENSEPGSDQDDVESDGYFLGTRVLNYQLLHNPKTKYHDPNVPFLVLHTPAVSKKKLRMLADEGATLVPVKDATIPWMDHVTTRWKSVMSKMQLWTFTDFDRILLIDSDTLIVTSLNGVFEDEGSQQYSTDTSPSKIEKILSHNKSTVLPPPPREYVLGGIKEGISGDRAKPANPEYLNAGFFMMAPSLEMYEYYMALVNSPGSFDPAFPEQNLLNHVHSRDGPMPWKELEEHWNTNCPSTKDIEAGWRTVHGHFWAWDRYRYEGSWACNIDPHIGANWQRVRGQMDEFYAQRRAKSWRGRGWFGTYSYTR